MLAPPASASGEPKAAVGLAAVDHVQLPAVDEPDQQHSPVAGRDHRLRGGAGERRVDLTGVWNCPPMSAETNTCGTPETAFT